MNNHGNIGEFEKIAELVSNRCFAPIPGQEFKTRYEVRALLVFDFLGHSILVYGDKSGELVIYNRTTDKEIIKVDEKGAIDLLEYTILPGDECLLFVGVRFQGIQVYKLKNHAEIKAEWFSKIESKKYIKLFFRNLIQNKKEKTETIEATICYDTGEVEIYDFAHKTAQFALKNSFKLPYCLSAYALDWDENGKSGRLFIGGSNGDIFRIHFMNLHELRFPGNEQELKDKNINILNIGGATVERMIPLSDYRKIDANGKIGGLFYEDNYGVLVVSNNKIICIYGIKSDKSGEIRTSTKVYPQRLFDVKCLCLPGFVYTVACDIEKNLHFIKNITDMEPQGQNIVVMFDGDMHIIPFESRITRFCFAQPVKNEAGILYQAYLGMGDHRVLPFNIFDPGSKLAEAKTIFRDLKLDEETGKDSALSTELEKIHRKVDQILDRTRYSKSRTAVKSLLLQIMADNLKSLNMNKIDMEYLEKNKHIFEKDVYKILDGEQTGLVQQTREILTKIEKKGLLHPYFVNSLQLHIRKFILDGKSYSDKQENLSRLVGINKDLGNKVDAMVYKGILAERQYDRVFSRHFDETDGAIIGWAPFKDIYLIFTAKGKIFTYDPNIPDEPPKNYYELSGDSIIEIKKFYIGKKYIYLLNRENNISIIETRDLVNRSQEERNVVNLLGKITLKQSIDLKECSGSAVCMLPQGKNREDKCLVGTNRGRIFYIEECSQPLEVFSDSSSGSEILYLRSFCYGEQNFIAAGYWNGSLKVFELTGEYGNVILDFIDSLQLDAYAVKKIYAFPDNRENSKSMSFPLIVAGTGSGKCYGLRLCPGNEEKSKFRLIHEWCYECGGEVKKIHPFSAYIDGKMRNFLLVTSQDKHIHVLEENGISVNTIRTDTPINNILMYSSSPNQPERTEIVEGFVTNPENNFIKTQFYTWKFNQKKFNESFDREYTQRRENVFLKYKSIAIEENFFKKYYYRRSPDIDSLDAVIDEMEALVDCGEFTGKTHILTSLIYRLFTRFFDELLKNEELFCKAKQIFIRTCTGWDLPGSQNNSRVQLYWIRSMLLGCWKSTNPKEMLNRWFKVGTLVADKYSLPAASPKNLIRSFVIHSFAFLRVKTLQYFQRFIMSPKLTVDSKEEDSPRTRLDEAVVESITGAIYEVLKMYKFELGEGSPRWIELEAARFLTWLIASSETCPIRLCYDLWKHNIPASFFKNLSNSIKIFPGMETVKEDTEILFKAAGELTIEIDRDKSQIEKHLPVLFQFCEKCTLCDKSSIFLKEFNDFSLSLAAFLDINNIKSFGDKTRLDKLDTPAKGESKFFSYKNVIDEFRSLYRPINQYYFEKYDDIYTDKAFKTLQYPTFKNIWIAIESIRENIANLKGSALAIEIKLYSYILERWGNIILHEVNNELILDFATAVRVYKQRCIDSNEPMDLQLILNNIFTRLNIMAECDRSYLLYLDDKSKEVIVIQNDGREEKAIEGKERFQEDIPGEWLNAVRFRYLIEQDIIYKYRNRIDNKTLSYLHLETPLLDQVGTQAVYLFYWEKSESSGFERIKSREILGEFITIMASLWTALQQQQEMREDFFRIVSHELRQILAGIAGWVSTLRAGYLENTPEVRQEYYERAFNSLEHAQFVIRGLLSFRDFPRLELKECELDKELDNPIKLQKIYYKDYRVELLIEKEDVDYTIVTDPGLAAIAVLNLLANARKYNPDRKPVRVNLWRAGHKIIIEVIDEGVGIPKSEHNIIFEKFERGSYAIENGIDGFGIGLTVSKNVIEAIGGNITLTSEVDKGSTFTITLDMNRFSKIQTILTSVILKRTPDFAAIEDADLRQKLLDKLEYNYHKKTLTLRGFLTEGEYEALRTTYRDDTRTKQFNIKALKKLYEEANKKTKKFI